MTAWKGENMAVRQLNNGSWKITVSCGRDANGKQIRHFKTYYPTAKNPSVVKKEVERAELEFEQEVKKNKSVLEKKTFNEVYREWDKEWASDPDNLARTTYASYKYSIERWALPDLGSKSIDKVTPGMIRELVKEMNEHGYAPISVRRMITGINSVFLYAFYHEYITENPIKRVKIPSGGRKRGTKKIHFFTADQAKRFLNALEIKQMNVPYQLQVFFYLAIYGGFRKGELLALTWGDIDFDNMTININKSVSRFLVNDKYMQAVKETKTESSNRVITLPKICFDKLACLMAQEEELISAAKKYHYWKGKNGLPDSLVFMRYDGRQMSQDAPYVTFVKAIKRYNKLCNDDDKKLPAIRLHDLRHTNATLLLASGQDIKTVSARLGHSRISVTFDYYIHAVPQADKDASQRIERLLE
jgi:integrase